MLEWIELCKELPIEGKMILIGDQHIVDVINYVSDHPFIKKMEKSIVELQWAYFNMPIRLKTVI